MPRVAQALDEATLQSNGTAPQHKPIVHNQAAVPLQNQQRAYACLCICVSVCLCVCVSVCLCVNLHCKMQGMRGQANDGAAMPLSLALLSSGSSSATHSQTARVCAGGKLGSANLMTQKYNQKTKRAAARTKKDRRVRVCLK